MSLVMIRCDATESGGLGHVVRGLAVATAARSAGWDAVLVGKVETSLARDLIAGCRVPVMSPEGRGLAVLAAETGAVVVHVDDYEIGPEARSQLAAAGALLSSVEDGRYGRRPADLVIDPTMGADGGDRPEDGSRSVLAGISYAPMRAEVLAARQRRLAAAPRAGRRRGLVVLGGTDAAGGSAAVAAVVSLVSDVDLTVVAPPRSHQAIAAVAGPTAQVVPPSPAFLDLAAESDFVVSAAGTTAWELVCIGVPTALVAVVENQRAGYAAAVAAGLAVGLGTLDELRADPSGAARALAQWLAGDASTGSRSVIDGRGGNRIVEAWQALLRGRAEAVHGAAARARPATGCDAQLLLRWRNDPAVRKVSRVREPVRWADHSAWLRGALEHPGRRLFVVEAANSAIGTVRFDELTGGEWEVSVTVAPEFRGQGWSVPVLRAAENAFVAGFGDASGARLVASVLATNPASRRLFEITGYAHIPDRRDGQFEVFTKNAVL